MVGNAPAPRLLAALAAGLLLAGCGSTAADTTPTPTPTHSYELTIVNDTSYELLLRLGPKDSVDSLIKTVCASTDPPQYLIDTVLASEPDAKLYVRLAVMAGCPERKDWS